LETGLTEKWLNSFTFVWNKPGSLR